MRPHLRRCLLLVCGLVPGLLVASCQEGGKPQPSAKPPGPRGELSLSAAEVRSAGIQLEPARRERLERVLTLTGTLAAAPWTPEEQAVISEAQQARARSRLAESNFARLSALYAQGIVSGQDLDLARAELDQARAIAEQADARGENLGLPRNVGSFGSTPGIWGLADLPEADLQSVAVGERVVVETDSVPDRRFLGRVVAISGSSDAQTRSFKVRIAVEGSTDKLRPQALAAFSLSLPALTGVTIPSSAVLLESEGACVYVAQGNTFRRQPVRAGPSSSGRVVVLEGLSDGQLVVTRGAQILESERLKSTVAPAAD